MYTKLCRLWVVALTDNVREISETTLEHFVNGILRTVRDLWPRALTLSVPVGHGK
jgi:hypothetical protein